MEKADSKHLRWKCGQTPKPRLERVAGLASSWKTKHGARCTGERMQIYCPHNFRAGFL